MRGKYRKANIVLTMILVMLLVSNIPAAIGMGLSSQGDKEWDRYYTRSMELAGKMRLEKIGDEYQEEKRKGYQYYSLFVPVLNTGMQSISSADLRIREAGGEFDDVYRCYPEYDPDETALIRNNKLVIPSMRQGELEVVLRIKKGAGEINVTFFPNDKDYYDNKNGTLAALAVPE